MIVSPHGREWRLLGGKEILEIVPAIGSWRLTSQMLVPIQLHYNCARGQIASILSIFLFVFITQLKVLEELTPSALFIIPCQNIMTMQLWLSRDLNRVHDRHLFGFLDVIADSLIHFYFEFKINR